MPGTEGQSYWASAVGPIREFGLIEHSELEILPVTLGSDYRGFVDYLFLKQDKSNMALSETTGLDGLLLVFAFLLKFPSIRRGYRDYRWLEHSLGEHAERGDSVVVSESGNTFTVKVR